MGAAVGKAGAWEGALASIGMSGGTARLIAFVVEPQWQPSSTDVLQAIRFGRKVRGLWLRPVRNAAWGRSHLFAMTFFDLDQRAYRENG
jgi:hypothetical protein